jgi:hypothetical protein
MPKSKKRHGKRVILSFSATVLAPYAVMFNEPADEIESSAFF